MVIGIIFVFIQINQADTSEKRKIAIDAISPIMSNDFTARYATIMRCYRSNEKDRLKGDLSNDLYYVVGVYDNIAILCIYGLADKKIIKEMSYDSIKEFLR